ncbi:MAG: carboxymuconolactone decarboxylase family protein [Alphaproteobacteria bacterium]|nr:carboxymuconolactone decarboxylase family protein [Alphaproteobacteria bacterium]MCB9931452.1 carboxymuconolactone decarboxylase family protein [Alphaproteobacteria bacterium]
MTQPYRLSTPRVQPLALGQMDPQIQEMLQRPGGFEHGQVLNVFATLAHHPQLLRRWSPLANHLLFKSTLPPHEREMVIMRAGWMAGCAYEWGQHVPIAEKDCQFTQVEFQAIAEGSADPLWNRGERALLAMAEQLYTKQFVDDAVWNELIDRYSARQILDAVFTACNYTTLAWALNVLGVQLDAGWAPPDPDLPGNSAQPSAALPSMAIKRAKPRLEPEPLELLGEKSRELYDKARGHLDRINVIQTMMHHPDLLRRWMPFFGHCLHKCELSLRERETVMLRIGRLCGSGYEWAQHRPIALERGLSAAEIAAIADGTLGGREGLLVEAVNQLHRTSMIDDALWARLSDAYSLQQILDLIFICGQYRMVSCALNTLAVQLDDYLEPYSEAA